MDAMYTVSEGLAEIFKNKYSVNAEVIMNVPLYQPSETRNPKPLPDWRTSGQAGETRNIIYQGALNEGRGLEALLELMQQVNGKLKLAGEVRHFRNNYGELAQKLNVQDKVVIYGLHLPPEKLRGCYPASGHRH